MLRPATSYATRKNFCKNVSVKRHEKYFRITYCWAYGTVATCTAAQISSGTSLINLNGYPGSGDKLDCVSGTCPSNWNSQKPSIVPYCTDVSADLKTIVGQRSDTVSLAIGSKFTVAFQDSAWRNLDGPGSGAVNSGADWSVSTYIDLTIRSDTGTCNSPPVSTMMSPINIVKGVRTVIQIPITDPDGDPMKCRWPSGTVECGQVCPPASLPSGTQLFPNCTFIITGLNNGDWYAATVEVEDFINSTSTTALSTVPVQFLINVVNSATCPHDPKIIGLPLDQGCIPLYVGQTYATQLIALNSCTSYGTVIDDIATLSFPAPQRQHHQHQQLAQRRLQRLVQVLPQQALQPQRQHHQHQQLAQRRLQRLVQVLPQQALQLQRQQQQHQQLAQRRRQQLAQHRLQRLVQLLPQQALQLQRRHHRRQQLAQRQQHQQRPQLQQPAQHQHQQRQQQVQRQQPRPRQHQPLQLQVPPLQVRHQPHPLQQTRAFSKNRKIKNENMNKN
ncbi:unnamed protein product [Didymodactylos carnosus]|uniref:Uncharacterized protein n=1 Tax=Didymodactylos carnosus TaxID=1234261 RepID=A0A8S2E4N7_9BILA|nr:unnamed protein product [Didymodactylos carnosus]CAF3899247.1 unnamed protein product [Didymodactylos carnosus]